MYDDYYKNGWGEKSEHERGMEGKSLSYRDEWVDKTALALISHSMRCVLKWCQYFLDTQVLRETHLQATSEFYSYAESYASPDNYGYSLRLWLLIADTLHPYEILHLNRIRAMRWITPISHHCKGPLFDVTDYLPISSVLSLTSLTL